MRHRKSRFPRGPHFGVVLQLSFLFHCCLYYIVGGATIRLAQTSFLFCSSFFLAVCSHCHGHTCLALLHFICLFSQFAVWDLLWLENSVHLIDWFIKIRANGDQWVGFMIVQFFYLLFFWLLLSTSSVLM